MENFLPALLIIGGVIYKIYTEYQKEQEKARRRMPQVPPPTPPVTSEQRPEPNVIEPTVSIPTPINKTERLRDIPKEVKKITDERLAEANRKKAAMKVVPEMEEEDDVVPFDLRKAVIQSAILNRPYP
ncbi:hypothetical protein H8B06_14790 [Sphingobacterium sp. DN00404]|uniref:Uncharacterized protein n=1 Tax=Sphingobacterium micropteri TaxID=2763501 RepID=A0ABR7YS65_9SPHI|nr:hypothetical protein [Sphingobacterium micropteri]MBD1434102.1 hypothetical protein [Sphingobacterium micropteri]